MARFVSRLRLTRSAHYSLSLLVPFFDPGPIGGRTCPRASATRCSTPTRWSAPRKLVARYRGLVTDVEFSIPAPTAREQGLLRELVQDIRRDAA